MNNIFVYVDGGETSASTVQYACGVAEEFGTALTGFYVLPNLAMAAAMPDGAGAGGDLMVEMQKQSEETAARAKSIFDKAVQLRDISGDWVKIDADLAGTRETMASVAHYAYLTVVGLHNPDTGAGGDPGLPQDLVVDTGRPIILVPPSTDIPGIGKNVMIAWKESREAIRAVYDSLPILLKAEKVTIMSIVKESKQEEARESGNKVKKILRDYGVEASLDVRPSTDGAKTSEDLLAQVRTSNTDLLVAGAYSRSRLREGLFGGVSKTLFESSPVPVFMSH